MGFRWPDRGMLTKPSFIDALPPVHMVRLSTSGPSNNAQPDAQQRNCAVLGRTRLIEFYSGRTVGRSRRCVNQLEFSIIRSNNPEPNPDGTRSFPITATVFDREGRRIRP